jgi:hypothetical protein
VTVILSRAARPATSQLNRSLRTSYTLLGSPTIRVDGRDIEPGAQWQEEYVCACRLYQVEYGLRGLPDEDWLRQALLAAEGRQ